MPRSSRSIRYDTYSLPACDSLLNLVNGMIMRDQLSGRILALAIRRSSWATPCNRNLVFICTAFRTWSFLPLFPYLGNKCVNCHLLQSAAGVCMLCSQPIKYLFLILRPLRTQTQPKCRIRGSTASVAGAYTIISLDSTDLAARRCFEFLQDNFEIHLVLGGHLRFVQYTVPVLEGLILPADWIPIV